MARTTVVQVDDQQTTNDVLNDVMTLLAEYHIMYSPNWTTPTADLKEFQFVLESDCLEHVGLDLFKQIPDVKFMIDIKDDKTDKSQFIVHPEGVRKFRLSLWKWCVR